MSMDRDQLIKEYAAIIDQQTEEILRLKGVRDKMLEEFHQIEQILGKALGYPWFKNDQKNFPEATEQDGVCVGAEVAWSLAEKAAERIKKLSKRHPTTEEALAQYHFIKQNSRRHRKS